jgi:hypothetical protein
MSKGKENTVNSETEEESVTCSVTKMNSRHLSEVEGHRNNRYLNFNGKNGRPKIQNRGINSRKSKPSMMEFSRINDHVDNLQISNAGYDTSSTETISDRSSRSSRPISPKILEENPYSIQINDFDLQLSHRRFDTIQYICQQMTYDEDVASKLQYLAKMSEYYLIEQQKNYHFFYQQKKQYEIDQWLASRTEEERKIYLENSKSNTS